MKKIFILLTLVVLAGLTFNTQSANATGVFYTEATYPVAATGLYAKDLSGLKQGTASSTNILFLVETGDAGINQAAKDGNIKQIYYIDMTEKSVFFFFRKLTTTVYGN